MLLVSVLMVAKIISSITDGTLDVMGIELITVPIIYIGIIYGPVNAFLFGFLVMPIIEVVRWSLKTPQMTEGWFPLIPSPDGLVDGLTGVVAGLLFLIVPIFWVGVVSIIIKNILMIIKDLLVFGAPPKPQFVINILLNIFLFKIIMIIAGI